MPSSLEFSNNSEVESLDSTPSLTLTKDFFGLYIHIPFCIQLCPYCSFAKYKVGTTISKKDYLTLLKKEIHYIAYHFSHKKPTSIYFGGGTPSTLQAEEIVGLILELKKAGFDLNQVKEVTVEVDPKTMDDIQGLFILKAGGVNRISLGVQSCNDRFLTQIGRIHRSIDIQKTIDALYKHQLSFSMDLLFGLPNQTLKDLEDDIKQFLKYSPCHISAYLLEVPTHNKLSFRQPCEGIQAEMFEFIEEILIINGLKRYEISNYAKAKHESQHNLLYWNDYSYLGLGLGAHSYLKFPDVIFKWGMRFWNPRTMSRYKTWVEGLNFKTNLYEAKQSKEREELKIHQSLTDFCHTQLRKTKGLSYQSLLDKYNKKVGQVVLKRCRLLEGRGLLSIYTFECDLILVLSKKGRVLSNLVFQELTFLKEECSSIEE